MRYEKECAEQDHVRRGAAAMVEAIGKLREIKPPCWRGHSHGPASHVVTVDGEKHAVCASCADDIAVDRQIARQKETRAAMGRR